MVVGRNLAAPNVGGLRRPHGFFTAKVGFHDAVDLERRAVPRGSRNLVGAVVRVPRSFLHAQREGGVGPPRWILESDSEQYPAKISTPPASCLALPIRP